MKKTMNLLTIVKAHRELQKLAGEKLPLKISWQIDKVIGKIGRPVNFYMNKEMELLEKYKPDKWEGYELQFNDPEVLENFNRERDELNAIEEEIDIEPVRIRSDAEIRISAESIRQLREAGMLEIIEEEAHEHGPESLPC